MAGSLRWLGHAAFLATSARGRRVFFDPWIQGNPLCPVKLEDLREADLILVSHDHFDHVGNAVELARKMGATVVAQPETMARLRAELSLPAEQGVGGGMGMNTGGTVEVKGVRVTMVQAFHSSATGSPVGYVVEMEDGTTLYHAGDTGVFESMRLLGQIYRIDVAMLPVGNFFTMGPLQAAHALRLIKPKRAVPMHYRTFPVLEQDARAFVEAARKVAPRVQVVVLEPGQEMAL